jgi:hypothetical protein
MYRADPEDFASDENGRSLYKDFESVIRYLWILKPFDVQNEEIKEWIKCLVQFKEEHPQPKEEEYDDDTYFYGEGEYDWTDENEANAKRYIEGIVGMIREFELR